LAHTYLYDGPPRAQRRLILAHGAGAGMDTDFMTAMAEGVAAAGIRVIRFEFPYMAARREDGRKRPPNGARILEQTWREVIDEHGGGRRCFVGGKSMGGRIASLVAQAAEVRGLVCLGYPFHPSGRPDRLRTEHLRTLTIPTLIIQGSRDSLGNREEVAGYELAKSIRVEWLEDGDHSFKPRQKSGLTLGEHLTAAVAEIVGFVKRR